MRHHFIYIIRHYFIFQTTLDSFSYTPHNECMIQDKKLINRLNQMARAKGYSIRDTQTLLEIDGYKRPSLDFIWKYFKRMRGNRIKRIA